MGQTGVAFKSIVSKLLDDEATTHAGEEVLQLAAAIVDFSYCFQAAWLEEVLQLLPTIVDVAVLLHFMLLLFQKLLFYYFSFRICPSTPATSNHSCSCCFFELLWLLLLN